MSQVLLNFINDINVSNTKTGTLLVNYGGTGTTILNSNQLLVGNATGAVIQSANLSWINSTNTLIATNISGSGTEITSLNATKITSGTLNVAQGGTGTTILNSNQLLVGNTTGAVIQSANLSWINSTNTLIATNFSGSGSEITSLNATKITLGTLNVAQGGTGTTNLNSNQLLVGNATGTVIQSANLSWNNNTNTLIATNFSGSGTGITLLNASKITLGTLNVAQGGTGTTSLTSGQILVGNNTDPIIQNNNFVWDNINNRLGIGKINPSTTLDVSGNILTNSQFLGTGTNISYSWLNDTTTGIGKPSAGIIGFYTNNIERLRILNNGDINFDNNTLFVDNGNNRIGIGTTEPNTKLHVIGDSKIDGLLTVKNLTVNGTTTIIDTNTQTTEQLLITNDGTGIAVIINQIGEDSILQLQKSSTTVLQVTKEGWLGFGIENNIPTAKIDISVNDNIGLKINQNHDSYNIIDLQSNNTSILTLNKNDMVINNTKLKINQNNDNYNIIDLQSNNTSILTLNKNDMIINNRFKLDISGNLIIKGNIYGKNTISKVGFTFTIKSILDTTTSTNIYYYNVNLSKYYTTKQTINSNNIQVFRLTTFDINGIEIETDFIYISSYNSGIKKIIKNRIATGDSQIYGWASNDKNVNYLTYYSDSIKTLYCILEPIL